MRFRRADVVPILVFILAAGSLPIAVLHFLSSEGQAPIDGVGHFAIVLVGSLVGAGAAIALVIAGARRQDRRVALVGAAFSVMTATLVVHAVATPGVIFGSNGVIALAGAGALPLGGAVLALSALPSVRRGGDVRPILLIAAGAVAVIVVVGALGLAIPDLVPAVPQAGSAAAWVLLIVGATFYTVIAIRAARTFLLTRRPADLVTTVGLVWLGVALIPVLLVTPGGWDWWLGHVLELFGLIMVAGPVAVDVHRTRPSYAVVGDLRASELVDAEEAFLGSRVRALMLRLAAKDTSTEGHTRRVALLSVSVGERLELAPSQLRTLALGGLLHDMGKLVVPDQILSKPGPLDDDEVAVIRRHPDDGDLLLAELGGFSSGVRRLVRYHHERLDGSGYPDGLSGDQLDLETRILAVCDVYDALISPRVYRPAWSADRALGYLREEAGRTLDARCVEALEAVVAAAPVAAESARVVPVPA